MRRRPRRLVLLQVDQQLPKSPCLRVSRESADPVGAVEVGEAEDVEMLGASGGRQGLEALAEAASPRRSHLDAADYVVAVPRITARR
jgi:hypothetical protein